MKIRQIGCGCLQTEIRLCGKSAVQKMLQNFLRGIKKLVLPGIFHKELFGQDRFNGPECLIRYRADMSVDIDADQITQTDAGTEQRREAAREGTVVQRHADRMTGGDLVIGTDHRAGFIGDLAVADGIVKDFVAKIRGSGMRDDVKGFIYDHQRAV